jgi:hypothetical protein
MRGIFGKEKLGNIFLQELESIAVFAVNKGCTVVKMLIFFTCTTQVLNSAKFELMRLVDCHLSEFVSKNLLEIDRVKTFDVHTSSVDFIDDRFGVRDVVTTD